MDSGYYQIVVNVTTRHKLAFVGVNKKLRFTVMPMGATNVQLIFVTMLAVI